MANQRIKSINVTYPKLQHYFRNRIRKKCLVMNTMCNSTKISGLWISSFDLKNKKNVSKKKLIK